MRMYVGALLIGAGISAFAFLMNVVGEPVGEQRTVSETAGQAFEAASIECPGPVLMGEAATGLSAPGIDSPSVPTSVVPVFSPEHPYPDHP